MMIDDNLLLHLPVRPNGLRRCCTLDINLQPLITFGCGLYHTHDQRLHGKAQKSLANIRSTILQGCLAQARIALGVSDIPVSEHNLVYTHLQRPKTSQI
jgi:hypothetical protein